MSFLSVISWRIGTSRARLVIALLGLSLAMTACAQGNVTADATTATSGNSVVASSTSTTSTATSTTASTSTSLATSTTATSVGTTTTSSAQVGSIRLVQGPYGFLVPAGWTESPLKNYEGPGSFAEFTDPSNPSYIIRYETTYEAGKCQGCLYNPDGTPDLKIDASGIGGTNSPYCLKVASSTVVAPNELIYTCPSQSNGTETKGAIIIFDPWEQSHAGFQQVQATMPVSDDGPLTLILKSFH